MHIIYNDPLFGHMTNRTLCFTISCIVHDSIKASALDLTLRLGVMTTVNVDEGALVACLKLSDELRK